MTSIPILKAKNGYKIYVDIMTGENCRQFRLKTWNLFIGQFVYPVGGEGMEGITASFTLLEDI